MSRTVILVVIAILIVAVGIGLTRIDASKPLKQVEKTIPDNALAH